MSGQDVLFDAVRPLIERIDGQVYYAVEDLVNGQRFEHRADEVLPAASTIKVAVMAAAFRMAESSVLDLGHMVSVPKCWAAGGSGVIKELHDGVQLSVLDLMTLMIILSDNTATSAMIDFVGFDGATSAARAMGAESTVIKRKLMGAAYYDRPDYSIAIDNTTSASDMVAIMKSIYKGTAASAESCARMIDILLRQQVNDRLPLWMPHGTKVAHKTGEFQTTRHDAGIVYPSGGKSPYAIALMSTGLASAVSATRALADIAKVIYDFMTK